MIGPNLSEWALKKRSLVIFLMIMAALLAVVGALGLAGTMSMNVLERTREIGLRKSLGARRRDILWQILTESITLSTFGGLCGTALGFFLAWVLSQVTPLPAIIEPWSVVLGISMTALVGLGFGLYPAMRAASRCRRRRLCWRWNSSVRRC